MEKVFAIDGVFKKRLPGTKPIAKLMYKFYSTTRLRMSSRLNIMVVHAAVLFIASLKQTVVGGSTVLGGFHTIEFKYTFCFYKLKAVMLPILCILIF
jgi:hypothetical protein